MMKIPALFLSDDKIYRTYSGSILGALPAQYSGWTTSESSQVRSKLTSQNITPREIDLVTFGPSPVQLKDLSRVSQACDEPFHPSMNFFQPIPNGRFIINCSLYTRMLSYFQSITIRNVGINPENIHEQQLRI